MLTTSTKFDEKRIQRNINHRLVLKITRAGSSDIYLSDIDFWTQDNNADVFVNGCVKRWGNVSTAINLFTKKYSISSITITLNNTNIFHSGTVEVPLSYELKSANYINYTAEIFVWYEELTDLTDNTDNDQCLKIFEGICQPIKDVTDLTFKLPLADKNILIHKNIVTATETAEFPVVDGNQIVTLPMVYGSTSLGDEINGSVRECVWVSDNKLIASDTVSKAINGVWFWDSGLNRFTEIDSSEYTITLDDSGKSTVTLNDVMTPDVWAYFFPKKIDSFADNSIPDVDDETECKKVGDQSVSTFLNLYCTVGADTDAVEFHLYNYSNLSGAGDIVDGAGNAYSGVKSEEIVAGQYNDCLLKFGELGDLSSGTELVGLDSPSSYTEEDVGATLDASMTWQNLIDDFYFVLYPDSKAAGYSTVCYKVYQVRLRIKYRPILSYNGSGIYVEIDGRKFGSWIDAGGRTPLAGQDDEGDLIEHPAYVIEDILRTELSVASADIDVDSFDNAATQDSSMKLAFNKMEQVNSLSLIQSICKQSKFFYFINGDGQHKLVPIKTSYTTNDILYKADIIIDSLKLSYTTLNHLINDCTVNYRKHQAGSKYMLSLNEASSTSKTTYNATKELEVNADMIDDTTTAQAIGDYFSDNTNGFWKDVRPILEFSTCYEYIHWDIGDIILINSSVDDIVRDGQNSWINVQMMIVGKEISAENIRFTMIKVATTGGGS